MEVCEMIDNNWIFLNDIAAKLMINIFYKLKIEKEIENKKNQRRKKRIKETKINCIIARRKLRKTFKE